MRTRPITKRTGPITEEAIRGFDEAVCATLEDRYGVPFVAIRPGRPDNANPKEPKESRDEDEATTPGIVEARTPSSILGEGNAPATGRPKKYSDELREHAVRLYFESGRPVSHVAHDLGIGKESLRQWVRKAEADQGHRPELLTTSEREELRRLRSENAELKRANAILRDNVLHLATEFDKTRRT